MVKPELEDRLQNLTDMELRDLRANLLEEENNYREFRQAVEQEQRDRVIAGWRALQALKERLD